MFQSQPISVKGNVHLVCVQQADGRWERTIPDVTTVLLGVIASARAEAELLLRDKGCPLVILEL